MSAVNNSELSRTHTMIISQSVDQCAICQNSMILEKGRMVVFFPSDPCDLAHRECFEKIKAAWQPLWDGLTKAFGDGASLKHKEVIHLIYTNSSLNPAKKTLLQLMEDPNCGQAGLSTMMQSALKSIIASKASQQK